MPPVYEYECSECGVVRAEYRTVETRNQVPDCHGPMVKLISRVMAFVSPDICYDSPIDGRHITSKQARTDDLARNNCIPYDPEMKTDHKRRLKEQDEKLEKAIDYTVDREIALMPARKREKLEAEIRHVDVVPERRSVESR